MKTDAFVLYPRYLSQSIFCESLRPLLIFCFHIFFVPVILSYIVVIIINSYVIMLLLCAVVFGSYMYLHVKVIIILSLLFCFKILLYVSVILPYIMAIIINNYVDFMCSSNRFPYAFACEVIIIVIILLCLFLIDIFLHAVIIICYYYCFVFIFIDVLASRN